MGPRTLGMSRFSCDELSGRQWTGQQASAAPVQSGLVMTTPTNVLPEITEASTATEAADLCAACGHPSANHDTTGLRYCAATVKSALTRGCICRNVT
jgi:hypothetical protein